MADKITNFEDYKKKGNVEDTTDIDIQIVDPYNFFNEEEREEYFQERQKELEREKEAVQEKEEPVSEPVEPEPEAKEVVEEEPIRRRRSRTEERYEEEDYSDDDYDEEEEDEESEGGFPIELFIRISSIITGILILAILAIVFKVKVYDKYLAPDPDQAQEVQLALPTGYIEKNDTVVVTAEKLNLRTVDNSQSDATIVTSVPKGTELSRIAVNEDGTWALVDYNGSRVYASMKYLSEK
ncbi:MAG: SH3 domain-containing protein [Butyrivibrio sp.]|uniref:SH3 domain-containing protein n=1 Tax=Butyrivibrio sp. TaxID=28121 RepID=UPI0025C610AD|nr:SH3 domain-containing protein [Butyrivibrio sp.]MBQ6588500.1 SH3 domain-containing protein [Butyrivibrio sp.]